MILEQDPPRPSEVARRRGRPAHRARAGSAVGAWAELDVLCLTAMHKDPERRYRTVDALMRDLDHFRAGEPLQARPDSVSTGCASSCAARWRPLSAAGAAAVVIVASGGVLHGPCWPVRGTRRWRRPPARSGSSGSRSASSPAGTRTSARPTACTSSRCWTAACTRPRVLDGEPEHPGRALPDARLHLPGSSATWTARTPSSRRRSPRTERLSGPHGDGGRHEAGWRSGCSGWTRPSWTSRSADARGTRRRCVRPIRPITPP